MKKIKRVLSAQLASTVQKELSCPLLALMVNTHSVVQSLKTTAQTAVKDTIVSGTPQVQPW